MKISLLVIPVGSLPACFHAAQFANFSLKCLSFLFTNYRVGLVGAGSVVGRVQPRPLDAMALVLARRNVAKMLIAVVGYSSWPGRERL